MSQGDANCPEGGSRFTAVNGDTYACNGENGQDGFDGDAGPQGPQGNEGPQGIPGPQGTQGPAGVSGRVIVSTSHVLIPNRATSLLVICPADKVVLGGGAKAVDIDGSSIFGSDIAVTQSHPEGEGWRITAFNASTSRAPTFTVYAICADAG